MPAPSPLLDQIKELLDSQFEGVLATVQGQQPHTNMMAYAHTPDLRRILIATKRDSQKYENLQANPQVSFMVDNRGNSPSDYQHALALSANGRVVELKGLHYSIAKDMFLERLPQLSAFMNEENWTMVAIRVENYYLVSHFNEVQKLEVL